MFFRFELAEGLLRRRASCCMVALSFLVLSTQSGNMLYRSHIPLFLLRIKKLMRKYSQKGMHVPFVCPGLKGYRGNLGAMCALT